MGLLALGFILTRKRATRSWRLGLRQARGGYAR
jgi:hypothetical protein